MTNISSLLIFKSLYSFFQSLDSFFKARDRFAYDKNEERQHECDTQFDKNRVSALKQLPAAEENDQLYHDKAHNKRT